MAWETLNLSTIDELKRNLPAIGEAEISDAKLVENIEQADRVIYDDLSKTVDWDNIEALTEVPRTLNRLSQYQTVVITLIREWRHDSVAITQDDLSGSILKYFQDRYDNLMAQISSGAIQILDSDNESLELDEVRQLGPGRVL